MTTTSLSPFDLASWALRTACAVMVLALSLSLAAAVGIPFAKYAAAGDFDWLPGAGLYLAFWIAAAWFIHRAPMHRERAVIAAIILVAGIARLAFVLITPPLPLNTDQEILRYFMEHMAGGGLSAESMRELSQVNDYSVWASRVLPAHYLMRWAGGEHHLLLMRICNVLASLATLALVARLSAHLLPAGAKKWAVFMMASLPLQSFITTDYSHHLYSSLYLLAGTVCVLEIRRGANGPYVRFIGLSCIAGLFLLLVMLQRGVHMIALAAWFSLAIFPESEKVSATQWFRNIVLMVGLPLLIAASAAGAVDRWLASHAGEEMGSALPGFMARGWCPETGGEYVRRFEEVEKATDPVNRPAAMLRLVLSQAYYNPFESCVKLPAIKAAKLFLAGYANNLEEALSTMQSHWLNWARGARFAAAVLFILFGLAGYMSLLATTPGERAASMAVIIFPVLVWIAYGILGETSPRYSIFCQAFLALAGGRGLAMLLRRQPSDRIFVRSSIRPLATAAAMLVVLYGSFAAFAYRLPDHRIYADWARGWTAAHDGSEAIVKPGDYYPFEARLIFPSGQGVATWSMPESVEQTSRVSFYLLGSDAPVPVRLKISGQSGEILHDAGVVGGGVSHISFVLPAGVSEINLNVHAEGDGVVAGQATTLLVGYFSYDSN